MNEWVSAHEMEDDLFISVQSYKIRFGSRILSRLNDPESIESAIVDVMKDRNRDMMHVRVRFLTEDSAPEPGVSVNPITKVRRETDGKLISLDLYDKRLIRALFGDHLPSNRRSARFNCTVLDGQVRFYLPFIVKNTESENPYITYINRRKPSTLPDFDELV